MGKSIPAGHQRILDANHHDPFAVLGKHLLKSKEVVRAFLPHAASVSVKETQCELKRLYDSDLFEWSGEIGTTPDRYQLEWDDGHGNTYTQTDPYCFPPQIEEYDLHLFNEGKHWHAYRFLGAHKREIDGVWGTIFATWAPNAERISVIGDFNGWDGRRHPMRSRGESGVWELFIPDINEGALYKFEIRSRSTATIIEKADPYAQQFELRPSTASIVTPDQKHTWQDASWMQKRAHHDWLHAPMSIYEVHLGSWQKDDHGHFLNYREAAKRLVSYVVEMGFTHIELLPITEHPFDGSWGYQAMGYFAPTSRFGTPDDFRFFMDHCHQNDIGVILDWVPGHFPKDQHGLITFDGTPLYEHEDPRLGEHADWGTLIFNYGRSEVKNFLLCSALYWLEEFHIDGLRVDAVASMIYLDYSREEGEWLPNKHGGNENLEAIDFLKHLNEITHDQHPGSVVIAEESTSWPMVSRPIYLGGLGFSMKWNMGWMNDTLSYMQKDPVHKQYHHDTLTFSQIYAYNENFMLPFSHDEVVHGKGSILNKMPGDEWQKFANLRLLYSYMFTHPGKKLLFMGCEFAQGTEWNEANPLDWYVLDYPNHKGVSSMVKDLNKVYKEQSALHYFDFEGAGFEWLNCHDSSQSTLSYLRKHNDEVVVVLMNFTPIPRENYRIGVPFPGKYEEVFNSDSGYYGGSNLGNNGLIYTDDTHWMGRPHSMEVTLPPLAAVIFKPAN